ncbi:carbon storage regulator [Thermobrachium celere]|uniref:Translational regulator CsrA n=1 Tax=Thermobrachium celere DSM 8682 TaxID=941824 RepID=R7RS25_9CLOT|nr:carbon storage regulator [Thermobrachium celere]CDF58030.1 Carbon storage regulator [Thermobrachium celere DSM 8682]
MLILTRKQGEKIKIGENIEITILDISQGNIKIGIEAPKNIKVIRSELLDEVKNQNIISIENIEMLIGKIKKGG